MAEVINLRMARKTRARAEAQDKAAANRARHGLTKRERERQRLDAEREARHIDGARREDKE
ncbi:MAG: DUF4169 family protein [Sphingomonadales bacterium]|nr:DUF4169 family protein [Sphingomonadales bacterium]